MFIPDHFSMNDLVEIRRIVHDHGWATLVTAGERGLDASHLPFLLVSEPGPPELMIEGHMARANPQWREFAPGREVLVVFQGPHGYVSPDWYEEGPHVPTWNYAAVHVHGVPEILEAKDTFDLLRRTVERFESVRERPWSLDSLHDHAEKLAPHTVAFTLRATCVESKAKLSQDKPARVRTRVMAALMAPARTGRRHSPRRCAA